MELFIEANGLWPELFKFIVVRMDMSDPWKFVQMPQCSLDLFPNFLEHDEQQVSDELDYLS